MASKKLILEVDFIGGQGSLTVSEEKALSDYFQNRKRKAKAKLAGTGAVVKKIEIAAS